jgi:hypothetical protein
MAQANDSITVTPGAGATVATHLANSKEHQVVVVAEDNGHIRGTAPMYVLMVPPIAVGANKLMIDLFNATGSGKTLILCGLWAVPLLDAAVTGVVAVRLHLFRTTAIGTAGTAATLEGVVSTAATISKLNPNDAALNANITARNAPGGGATQGAWLLEWNVAPEESNTSMGYMASAYNVLKEDLGDDGCIMIPENTGIRINQGAVASVGSIGFRLLFKVI